jgi:hypothetical protein
MIHQGNPLQGVLSSHHVKQFVVADALQLQQPCMKILLFDEVGQLIRIGRPVQFPPPCLQIAKKLGVQRIIQQRHDVSIYRSHSAFPLK